MKCKCVFLFVCIKFLISCNSNEKLDSVNYYKVPTYKQSFEDRIIHNIKIDTIELDNNIESSFYGSFFIKKDTLYFADELFNYIYRFNFEGKLIDRHLGKGKGLKEIKGFHNSTILNNKVYFINEFTSEITGYDSNFNKELQYKIDWQIKRSKKEVLEKPIPTVGDSYEFDFGIGDVFKAWDKNHFAIAITTSHPKFNGYFNSDLYYNHSRVIGIVEKKSGKVVDLIGRRTPELLKYKNLPNFDHFAFENVDNNILINFWCDSIMYVIDKQSKLSIGKFGVSGKDLKTDYFATKTYKQAHSRWSEDINTYGYYYYLKYITERKLLFRGYKKGDKNKFDGLQIYSDYSLIGDINVPKGFKIIGSIAGDLIAQNKINEEQFEIYKVNINYEK